VIFHVKQSIQELNYDALKEVKILELKVGDNLQYIVPQDFVNWVRISEYSNGYLFPLVQNIQTNYSQAYLQDNDSNLIFDEGGNVIKVDSIINQERLDGSKKSIYLNNNSPYHNMEGWNIDGGWYFEFGIGGGGAFGLNTSTANKNATFSIDIRSGVINFSSDMANKLCVLEYISDGMMDGDTGISVHKFFEKYIYADVHYQILSTRINIQEYVVRRFKNKRRGLVTDAKIRMADFSPERLLMDMRGMSKWLK
jgi:hypothetical protein